MSNQNVPQDKTNFEQVVRDALQHTDSDTFNLESSPLNPVRGYCGDTRALEGLGVALRKVAVLLAGLEDPDGSHPCFTEDNLRETVTAELLEIEAMLEATQAAAQREADARAPKAGA